MTTGVVETKPFGWDNLNSANQKLAEKFGVSKDAHVGSCMKPGTTQADREFSLRLGQKLPQAGVQELRDTKQFTLIKEYDKKRIQEESLKEKFTALTDKIGKIAENVKLVNEKADGDNKSTEAKKAEDFETQLKGVAREILLVKEEATKRIKDNQAFTSQLKKDYQDLTGWNTVQKHESQSNRDDMFFRICQRTQVLIGQVEKRWKEEVKTLDNAYETACEAWKEKALILGYTTKFTGERNFIFAGGYSRASYFLEEAQKALKKEADDAMKKQQAVISTTSTTSTATS